LNVAQSVTHASGSSSSTVLLSSLNVEYHQDELRRTLIVAAVGHKRALDVYKKASDDLYRASVASRLFL
jgi:hypothetical protein